MARTSSLWKRNLSPMTCLQHANRPQSGLFRYSRCRAARPSVLSSDRLDVAVALSALAVRDGTEHDIATAGDDWRTSDQPANGCYENPTIVTLVFQMYRRPGLFYKRCS